MVPDYNLQRSREFSLHQLLPQDSDYIHVISLRQFTGPMK